MERSDFSKLKIFRYTPGNPIYYQDYEVPWKKNFSVLQALHYIHQHSDDPPAFRRYQCNKGLCASCVMTIDGKVRRACVTSIEKGEMVIEPLKKFPIIRDLVVDFGKVINNKLMRSGTIVDGIMKVREIGRAQPPLIQLSEEECTGCGACQEICPVNKLARVEDKDGGIRSPGVTYKVNENRQKAEMAGVCPQCNTQDCLNSCPTGALRRNTRGIVTVDQNLCIGCKLCLIACPIEAIFLDLGRSVAVKCDYCESEPFPLCVSNCPVSALKLDGKAQF